MYFATNKEGFIIPSPASDQIEVIPSTGVPVGKYMIPNADGSASKNMAPIPYGYAVDSNGKLMPVSQTALFAQVAPGITKSNNTNPTADKSRTSGIMATHYTLYKDELANSKFATGDWVTKSTGDPTLSKYNKDNLNVEYHDNDFTNTSDSISSQGTWVRDKDGNMIYLPWSDISNNVTYYQPGTYPYGSTTFVPSYEDSVYLSRTSGLSSVKQFYDDSQNGKGFCQQQNDNSGLNIEQKCNALGVNSCANTDCCVLLGGAKCVAGNEKGPKIKSVYSDISIRNKDYYYFKGKCYGNCAADSNPFFMTDTDFGKNINDFVHRINDSFDWNKSIHTNDTNEKDSTEKDSTSSTSSYAKSSSYAGSTNFNSGSSQNNYTTAKTTAATTAKTTAATTATTTAKKSATQSLVDAMYGV